MFWTVWLATIVICFFFARATFKINGNVLANEMSGLIFYIVIWLIPFINVIILGAVWVTEFFDNIKLTPNKVIKKILFIKDDDDDNE